MNEGLEQVSPRITLGRRVRRYREKRGLSLRQLSGEIGGYSHSYLGRVELGEQLPSEALTSAMERFFDCDGVLEELLELAQSALIPRYGRSLIDLERSATRLEVFTSSVVPGLLQTADYARELLRRSLPGKSDDELDDLVVFRLKRHRIFQREGDPLYYWAVIDEAALRRPIGGEETMAAQLRHLLERAAHPLVTVQVLPFDRGAHPVLGGSLILYSLSDGSTVVGIESFGDARIVDSGKQVAYHSQLFDVARSLSLTEDDSLDLIRTYLKDYEP